MSNKMQENDLKDPNSTPRVKGNVNQAEKESSNNKKKVDGNIKNKEPFYLNDHSRNDSLENLTSSTFLKSDEKMEVDEQIKNKEPTTVIESIQNSDQRKTVKMSINKSNPKRDFSPSNKIEKLKSEKKALDPRIINDEIRRNYENEIFVLKKQLQQAGLQSNPSDDALLNKCQILESQLRKSQNEAESMTEQVTGLRTQLQTWPNRIRELEDENETLRGRIEDVRVINQQRQNEIDELHEIVKNLETKLWEQSTGSHQQEKIFLQRLMSEYDNLLKDYDLVKMNNMTNERKMYDARSRISELTNKVSELEISHRKIESENSFLKRRTITEKSYGSSNYRGWDRNVYPPHHNSFDQSYHSRNGSSQELMTSQQNNKPSMETGMMSISCYGALPSYNETRESNENVSTLRRFEYNKCRDNERYDQNVMSQSVYVQSQKDISNVSTPTNDRRQVSILDKVNYGNNGLKDGPTNFDILNDENVDLMTQSMNRPINDFMGSSQASRRRQKPEFYNRDSWAESKSEEEKELERRYDQLQNEKKQLLTNLSHVPTNSAARNRRTNREQRETLEAQLDHIDRQLGLMRMTLKQKNILK